MPDQDRELLRKLIKQYNLKDTTDIKNMLKDLFGNTIVILQGHKVLGKN